MGAIVIIGLFLLAAVAVALTRSRPGWWWCLVALTAWLDAVLLAAAAYHLGAPLWALGAVLLWFAVGVSALLLKKPNWYKASFVTLGLPAAILLMFTGFS